MKKILFLFIILILSITKVHWSNDLFFYHKYNLKHDSLYWVFPKNNIIYSNNDSIYFWYNDKYWNKFLVKTKWLYEYIFNNINWSVEFWKILWDIWKTNKEKEVNISLFINWNLQKKDIHDLFFKNLYNNDLTNILYKNKDSLFLENLVNKELIDNYKSFFYKIDNISKENNFSNIDLLIYRIINKDNYSIENIIKKIKNNTNKENFGINFDNKDYINLNNYLLCEKRWKSNFCYKEERKWFFLLRDKLFSIYWEKELFKEHKNITNTFSKFNFLNTKYDWFVISKVISGNTSYNVFKIQDWKLDIYEKYSIIYWLDEDYILNLNAINNIECWDINWFCSRNWSDIWPFQINYIHEESHQYSKNYLLANECYNSIDKDDCYIKNNIPENLRNKPTDDLKKELFDYQLSWVLSRFKWTNSRKWIEQNYCSNNDGSLFKWEELLKCLSVLHNWNNNKTCDMWWEELVEYKYCFAKKVNLVKNELMNIYWIN